MTVSDATTFDATVKEPAVHHNGLDVVNIYGMPINAVTMDDAANHIADAIDRGQGGWLLTPNVDILRRWTCCADFRRETSAVTLCVADGMPLIWTSRLLGTPLPERVTGVDLATNVIAEAARRGHSVFLLGGPPGIAVEAARRIRDSFPDLRVAGTYCPPFGFEKDPDGMAPIRNAVQETQPDIVIVGLSSPKQEWTIEKCRNDCPQTWWLGVGCTLSVLSGHVKRAPGWMQSSGLEWFYRLVQQPRYLFRRYLFDDLPFFMAMMFNAFRRRARRCDPTDAHKTNRQGHDDDTEHTAPEAIHHGLTGATASSRAANPDK